MWGLVGTGGDVASVLGERGDKQRNVEETRSLSGDSTQLPFIIKPPEMPLHASGQVSSGASEAKCCIGIFPQAGCPDVHSPAAR